MVNVSDLSENLPPPYGARVSTAFGALFSPMALHCVCCRCIARLLSPDLEKVANRGAKGMLVRRLSRYFNGKPMLWRFFGVWGNCVRCGAAQFINMDFCSGGAIKNAAFFEGLKYLHKERIVWELSFTLEGRAQRDEMPERLLGGAPPSRPTLRPLAKCPSSMHTRGRRPERKLCRQGRCTCRRHAAHLISRRFE
jgi:hypothetical protein